MDGPKVEFTVELNKNIVFSLSDAEYMSRAGAICEELRARLDKARAAFTATKDITFSPLDESKGIRMGGFFEMD
jgi:hypothetical protein